MPRTDQPGPSFDPEAPCDNEGLFGLPPCEEPPAIQVIAVPFEASASFGKGSSQAPRLVCEASAQVDLFDVELGEPWRAGITMLPEDPDLEDWNTEASERIEMLRQHYRSGSLRGSFPEEHMRVDAIMTELNSRVRHHCASVFNAGATPGILGGDHSVAFGAIQEASARFPGLGVLQLDAHADLRQAYEAFRWSHASIMYNVLSQCSELDSLVQVGIRDLARSEWEYAHAHPKVHCNPWALTCQELDGGTPFSAVTEAWIRPLPERVWLSVDIDGLNPALCPGTGTPVPGGLSWDQCIALLRAVASSGRRIVGFDLCEIGASPWDANVGARLLYQLAGWTLRSQGREIRS